MNILEFESLPSTNDYLKQISDTAADFTVAVAKEQTLGKGSRGRSFFSPGGGLYMSVLIKRDIPISSALFLTPLAAVAVCEGLEAAGAPRCGIKWVNDVYIGGRKVCGILTETKITADGKALEYAIIGIGVNIAPPPGGFPEDIKDRAGAVFTSDMPGLNERCRDGILKSLAEHIAELPKNGFLEDYRSRSVLLGKKITVDGTSATAISIDDECRLVINDGISERTLNVGDVSIKL